MQNTLDKLLLLNCIVPIVVVKQGKCTMIDCIADIELWCRSHGLKLNADKSDVIWLGSWYTRQQLAMISQADKDLHLPDGTLRVSETARITSG